MRQSRYYWQKPSDLPDRIELMDSVTKRPAAVILSVSRRWHWRRETSLLMHGALPAEGRHNLLDEAKLAVVNGLPDAPDLCRKKPR